MRRALATTGRGRALRCMLGAAVPRLVLLITLSVLALVGAGALAAELFEVGDEVPDLALDMADGTQRKLSSHEGKVVVLFFYGPWSKHCREPATSLDAVRKARAKQKLVVVGVARGAKPAEAREFAKELGLGFDQALDRKSELYARFATKGIPWVAVIDAKRRLRYGAAGWDEEAVETALTELLGARDPPAAPAPKKDSEKKDQ